MRFESISSASGKTGLPAGSLVHIGEVQAGANRISVNHYHQHRLTEGEFTTIAALRQEKGEDSTLWVEFEGLSNVERIGELGDHFGIHPLVLEDILNTQQRPKFEEFEEYLFIVLKGFDYSTEPLQIRPEQISILILPHCIFTFKEKTDALFEPVKRRLANGPGRQRNLGPDYLAYVILDTIVDRYFSLQDTLAEVIEAVEDDLLTSPTTLTLGTIQRLKRELIFIRRSITPVRELLSGLERSESPLLQERTQLYLRDVYDHVLRVSEAMDSYRDLITGMLDIYLSSINNKMSEIMKVLTVFTSIFAPLTFIAGIYGMNFQNMPELQWRWSYPTVWLLFLLMPLALLRFFRKKKWL